MKLNRKGVVLGTVALGFAGALATGIGIAQADPGPSPQATTSASQGPGLGRGQGMMVGQRACFSAAATYLGLSETDLQAQLRSGKTLADLAKAQGKSESGLKDAMVAAAKQAIDANTALTAEQKATALDQATSRIEAMITRSHQPGAGLGRKGGGGGGFGRGLGNQTS
ncbi:MAG: hypothetical protein JXA67_02305 [Micromonosporaceae bacterium]|nr:hypothetical protein [Micromonosporaceae bacterium]